MQSSTWKPEMHVYSTGKQVDVWIRTQQNGTKFTDLSREGESTANISSPVHSSKAHRHLGLRELV